MTKRQREKLSLDDPRWSPLVELHKALSRPTGDPRLAAFDLATALANDRLRCMRRNLTGESEAVPATFWADHELRHSRHRGLAVLRPSAGAYCQDWVFYGWQPDFVEVRPGLLEVNEEVTPPHVRPGPKPRNDWPTRVAAWLILKAIEDPRQLENVDALVDGAVAHLQEEIDWAPENTGRIRTHILDCLRLKRR